MFSDGALNASKDNQMLKGLKSAQTTLAGGHLEDKHLNKIVDDQEAAESEDLP